MKTTFRPHSLVLTLAAVGALAGLPAFAADAPQQHSTAKTAAPATQGAPTRDARASKVIGREVRDASGQKLGEIKDLIVDMRTGRLQYAVLDFGGVLGVGDKLFAYPVNAFRTSTTTDDLVLNVDKERLRNAPGFDKSHWPGLDQDAY